MPARFGNRDIIEWTGDSLRFLDQTRLPHDEVTLETRDYRDVIEALRTLRLRGAPLIGIAAAYAVLLAAREFAAARDRRFTTRVLEACDNIAAARPTAVNLFWALDQCRVILQRDEDAVQTVEALEILATGLHDDDARRCADIGRHGAVLVPDGAGIITHCNTGALATGGEGTALAVILAAAALGKRVHVYADETRPLLQGARLTMWELQRRGVPATLITDGSAAALFATGRVQLAITGADRIARNGDAANKIGTRMLAIAAAYHKLPFYIAAPLSTFDRNTAHGYDIPIEMRSDDEITTFAGQRIAPAGMHAWAPAFDVTPAALIERFITERGIFAPSEIETLVTYPT